MPQEQAGTILQHFRKLIDTECDLPDAQLLERFVSGRDERAFAALMQRHGPGVLALCNRMLRHTQDAEDVFQATFLVLARMARSIRKGEAVGSWLYGVAYRIARKASRTAARRRQRERQVPPMPKREEASELALRDLQVILDEEVDRLPQKYRAGFVLCCLQAKSRAEAAQELGWKEGTLASRLAQARTLLQGRLTRRGVALSAALGAAALSRDAAQAVVPATLAASTLRAAIGFAARQGAVAGPAVALAKEALLTMFLTRVKRASLLLAALVLMTAGAGLAAKHAMPGEEQAAVDNPDPPAVDNPGPPAAVQPAQVRTDRYGDALPDGVVRRFGTLRLRHCGPVVFSPDGKQIVTAGGDKATDVVFWERDTGKELRRIKVDHSIHRLQFSPNGKRLAVMLGTVSSNPLLDVDTGKVLFKFQGEYGSFSRDGDHLFGIHSGQEGRLIKRWEVANGKPAGVWTLPEAARFASCAPDGKTAVYATEDMIVVYDLATKTEKQRWPAGRAWALTFSPDGKKLAAWIQRGIRLWDVASGKQEFAWDRIVEQAFAFTSDGKRLAFCGYDWRSISHPWVLDIGEAEPRRLGLAINNTPSHLAMSPDNSVLAVNSDAHALELRDLATGKDALPFDANTGRIFGLQLSPDGRHLATLDNFRVLVWEKATGKLIRRFPDEAEAAKPNQPPLTWDIRLGADGELKRGNANNTYGHWDYIGSALPRLQKLNLKDTNGSPAFAEFKGTVIDVLESPDGRYLAVRESRQGAGFIDRSRPLAVRIWDMRAGRPVEHLPIDDGQLLGAFSPDARLLAVTTATGTVQLWEMATGKQRLSLRGHLQGAVRSLLFTPDSRFLFSGGDDSQVLQWDVTGRTEDGVWRTVQHEPKKLQELWDKLAAADAGIAHKTIWEFAADPAGTVAFLQAKLKPATAANAKQLGELIAQLGADDFDLRQAAQAKITQIGEPAVPALRAALAKSPALETARRLEKLIAELAPPALTGEPLRSHRALEVLERIATPQARDLLSKLAKGAPGHRLADAAKESLGRLGQPNAP